MDKRFVSCSLEDLTNEKFRHIDEAQTTDAKVRATLDAIDWYHSLRVKPNSLCRTS